MYNVCDYLTALTVLQKILLVLFALCTSQVSHCAPVSPARLPLAVDTQPSLSLFYRNPPIQVW